MTHVDVAIIGTGPGGGMAACRLARTGLRVLLLEKATLPRSKPCGGAMPTDVRQLLDWDFSSVIDAQPRLVRSLYNHASPKELQSTTPILMVNRSRFDQHLVERAVSLGTGSVHVRETFTVDSVDEDATGVSIRNTDGEHVRADYLIAADGAFSTTAQCLGLKRRTMMGAAIDVEVEVDPDVYEAEAPYATFNFNCVPGGYGWIFPKDGYLTCGVGSWRRKARLQQGMRDFLERSFPPGSIRSVQRAGHPIPLFAGHQPIATRRVCLVGDAAGLVDPVMGEGIRMALKSGALAADVIAGLLGAGNGDVLSAQPLEEPDCRAYQALIRQGIGRDLDMLYRLILPIFVKAPEFFFRTFYGEGQSYYLLSQQLAARLNAYGT